MSTKYNQKHCNLQFQVGDLVWLRIPTYKQSSVVAAHYIQLAPKFYGPFPVQERIGQVAYKLTLPSSVKIHPVFHLSELKKFERVSTITPILPLYQQGHLVPQPKAILDARKVSTTAEILIHWEGYSPAEASWQDAEMIKQHYPTFAHEVMHALEGRSNVMQPFKHVYVRKGKKGTWAVYNWDICYVLILLLNVIVYL